MRSNQLAGAQATAVRLLAAQDLHRMRAGGARASATQSKREDTVMAKHKTGTRKEWQTARRALLKAEKALTHRSEAVAQRRQELPWVRIDKEYRLDTDEGTVSL